MRYEIADPDGGVSERELGDAEQRHRSLGTASMARPYLIHAVDGASTGPRSRRCAATTGSQTEQSAIGCDCGKSPTSSHGPTTSSGAPLLHPVDAAQEEGKRRRVRVPGGHRRGSGARANRRGVHRRSTLQTGRRRAGCRTCGSRLAGHHSTRALISIRARGWTHWHHLFNPTAVAGRRTGQSVAVDARLQVWA